MKNKKIIIIAMCLILSFVGLMYYANFVQVSAKEVFEQDGYVLNSSLKSTDTQTQGAQQFYFKANSAYQKKWPSKILFHDTEASKVVLDNVNFLHYTNGDMGAFTDGVMVDMNKLNDTPISYYRIKAGAILKKSGSTYQMNYLNKKITMTDFIWKLSDTKYIVVSPQMQLVLGSNNKKEMKGYIEVEIQDKGIVTFHNQNASYQTIVDGSNITLNNGIVIDFNKKDISKAGKSLFSLTQMVVDSNSNIEIVPAENKSKEESDKTNNKDQNGKEEGKDNNEGQNGTNGNPAGETPAGNQNGNAGNQNNANGNGNNSNGDSLDLSGLVPPNLPNADTGGDNDSDTENPSNVSKTIPSVQLASLKSSIMGVSIKGTINDPDDLLTTAGVNVKIFEKSSNKLVYSSNISKGEQKIDVDVETLKTNTDYVLVISGTYVFNNVEYTNDLLNKQFTTEMLDLSYNLIETTDTTLSYKVKADENTKISSATLVLYDKDKVKVQEITLNEKEMKEAATNGYRAVFDNLSSNTKYYVKMTNVIYDTSMTITDYDTFREVMTLKETPTLEQPSASVDKRNDSFILYPGKVTDKDKGIQKYRFEIIDAVDANNVVYSADRDLLGNVEVHVDGKNILRKHNYFFRIVAVFNDNNKTIEIQSPASDIFSLDTKDLPTLSFVPTMIRHDAIEGTIHIDDTTNVILKGKIDSSATKRNSQIAITATDAVASNINLGASATTEIDDSFTGKIDIPINISGLRANETHTFKIYADVNLGEQAATPSDTKEFDRLHYYIGELRVNTSATVGFNVRVAKNLESDPAILSQRFVLNTQLLPGTADEVEKTDYEANTLNSVEYSVYRGTVPADKINTTAPIGSGTMTADKGTAEAHNSSLKALFYDAEGQIRADNVSGVNWNTYNAKTATIAFKTASDYVGNKIDLGGASVYSFTVNAGRPAAPGNVNDALTYRTIVNSQLGNPEFNAIHNQPYPDLQNNTIVGYSYRAQLNNSAGTIREINYDFYDMDTNQLVMEHTQNLTINDTTVPAILVPVGYGTDGVAPGTALQRGHRYRVEYTAQLDLNYDGVVETRMPDAGVYSNMANPMNAVRQAVTYKTKTTYNAATQRVQMKYLLRDVDARYRGNADGAIPGTIKSLDASGTVVGTSNITLTRSASDNDWKTITIPNVAPGISTVNVPTADYNTAGRDTEISRQRVYDRPENPNAIVNAETSISNNHLNVRLTPMAGVDANSFRAMMNSITAAKITVTDTSATNPVAPIVLDNKAIAQDDTVSSNGLIRIPLQDIHQMAGKPIEVKTELYYIDGNAFTDLDSLQNGTSYAVEIVNPNNVNPLYLINNGSGTLTQQTLSSLHASGSLFHIQSLNGSLTITSKINKGATVYTSNYSQFPLVLKQGTSVTQNVILKEINSSVVQTNNTSIATGFDKISGNISMRNQDGALDFIAGIDRINLKYTFNSKNATASKDNKVYFELYAKQADGSYPTTATKTYSAAFTPADDNARKAILLDGLSLKQTYKLKVYTILNDGLDTHQYVYDIDAGKVGAEYTFTTSDKVDVTNITGVLQSSKNTAGTVTRNMKLSYKLSQIGFSKIVYTVYGGYDETTGNFDETTPIYTSENADETTFKTDMTTYIPVGSGAGQLKLGEQYKVKIDIYSDKTPYGPPVMTNIGTGILKFKLANLRTPIVNMQLLPDVVSGQHKITATINVNDLDFTSPTSTYKIALVDADNNDITPAAIKNQVFNYSTKNQIVTFDEPNLLHENTEYSVQLTTSVDLNATGATSDFVSKQSVTTLNQFGIAIGSIDITKNLNSTGKADLMFYDSVNLNRIKKINYTLYNTSTGETASVSDEVFDIVSSGTGSGQYWTHTIGGFAKASRYLIEVQFLTDDNTVVGTASLSYSYR